MSVVSVSTGEGGVAADVVASVVAPLPEAIGTQRGEANERGRLTGLNSEESRSERISESASHAETRGSPPPFSKRASSMSALWRKPGEGSRGLGSGSNPGRLQL